jgi:hypothetical protein
MSNFFVAWMWTFKIWKRKTEEIYLDNVESKSLNSNRRSVFLRYIWLLFFPTSLLMYPLAIITPLYNIIPYFVLVIHVVLLACVLVMVILFLSKTNTLKKGDKNNFLFQFFDGNTTAFSRWSYKHNKSWLWWCFVFFVVGVSLQDLFIIMTLTTISTDKPSTFYVIYWVITNIFVIAFVILTIIGKEKYTQIYGKKIKSLK